MALISAGRFRERFFMLRILMGFLITAGLTLLISAQPMADDRPLPLVKVYKGPG